MTKVHYTTESHQYPDVVDCAIPGQCRRYSHYRDNGDEYATIGQAREAATLDDAPAVRIIKVTVTTEHVEIVAG